MKNAAILLWSIILVSSCDSSKWETIKGSGINDEPKSIGNVIYFENENEGVVGGYYTVRDANAENDFDLTLKPILFLTQDGGRNWTEVLFSPTMQGAIENAIFSGDTLICQIDSSIFLLSDGGKRILAAPDSNEQKEIIRKHFSANRHDIKTHDFFHQDKKYYIKEIYRNEHSVVNVCYGEETMTDYYFVSFDKGATWTFLQKTFGDNRARFLLRDKYLLCYDFPFGLRRLKLK